MKFTKILTQRVAIGYIEPYVRIWPIASPCREEICVRGGYGTPTDSYGIQLITSFNHLFVTAIQLNLGQYNSDG